MKPNKALAGDIAMDIVWSLLSCGIYSLFWQNRVFHAANALVEEERFSFWPWLGLTIITCGLYNLYAQYKVGEAIMEGQNKLGLGVNDTLGWLSILLNFIGLHIVSLAIFQNEINKLAE